MTLIPCPFCRGGAERLSGGCVVCNDQGVVSDGGPPRNRDNLPTERYAVTGAATERVIVRWQDGTEHTLYRPPREER